MTSPTPVRFPPALDRAIAAYARRAGTPKSTVVTRATDEWLRMQAHRGITFVTTNTGERRAALTSGPQVWTVAESWMQHDPDERSAEVTAETLGLTISDVETALNYWADHRDEIDGIIALHYAEQDAALRSWERRQALRAV